MKKILKQAVVYASLILLLTGIFVGLGTLSAMIPHEAVADNIDASSQILGDGIVREYLLDEEYSTIIDNFADAAIMNLAWHSDSSAPMKSFLSNPYRRNIELVNDNQMVMLRDSVEGAEANSDYSRYWHGMLIFVRPLLTVMDLSGIRVVNIVVLASLAGIFIWLLVRRKQYALLTGYILSIVLLYVAIVPMCMEFMPTFVLFHVFSIVLLLWDEKLESYMQYLFLIFGALTCYFDFLTTETLVFVVPMLIILCIRGRDGRLLTFRQSFFATVQYGLSWLFGYGIFFPIKWILASFAKEELTLGAAFAQAMSHTDFAGELDGLNAIWLDAVVAPIGRIFPFTFSQNGWLILTTAILIMMVYGLLWFQFRKEKVPGYAWIVLLVGFIPFARYLVLMSHTVVHGFMVFRAQLGTFMALTAFMANAAQLHKPKKIKAAVHHKKGKRK